MAILKEVEFPLGQSEIVPAMEYFKSLYEGKPNNTKTAMELASVISSILSGHVPVVLECVYDFIPGLLKIVPDLKSHLDEIPERTNHFIGWIRYNPNKSLFPDTLAQLINDALEDYSGPIHANDVFSSTHSEVGIVFTSKEVEQADADAYFEDMLNQYHAEGEEDDDFDGEDCPFDE